jgi:hypothetical protein
MLFEFTDNRPEAKGKDHGATMSMEMPEEIGERFRAHLQRKRDAATPRGRQQLQAEIESTL